MYQLLDSDLPADCFHHKAHASWSKSTFDTLEEAQEYLLIWVGGDYEPDHPLKTGEEYDYSGFGDIVKIIEVT